MGREFSKSAVGVRNTDLHKFNGLPSAIEKISESAGMKMDLPRRDTSLNLN